MSEFPPSPPPSPLPAGIRFWILCRVIDNFGDAGVCWRLARQLAREHRAAVTLYVDRPELIARLAGPAGPRPDVSVQPWPADDACPGRPPDVLISAFGCEPPARVRALLAGGPTRPLWLNLEYLSAEAWVDGCHGLSSVKPADLAIEHFFYPGFGPGTNGLLREHDAYRQQAALPPSGGAASRQALCGLRIDPAERLFTLFCYPQAPLDAWLPLLAAGGQPTLLAVPEGVANEAIERFAGAPLRVGEAPLHRGRLRLARFAFLPQDRYDALLRLADLNFVRGEDSWLRAHWARRPFVWQPYIQQGGTHHLKLAAFLDRMAAALGSPVDAMPGLPVDAAPVSTPALTRPSTPAPALATIGAMMRAWIGDGDLALAWRSFESQLRPVDEAFSRWVDRLVAQPDLALQLASWVARKL